MLIQKQKLKQQPSIKQSFHSNNMKILMKVKQYQNKEYVGT